MLGTSKIYLNYIQYKRKKYKLNSLLTINRYPTNLKEINDRKKNKRMLLIATKTTEQNLKQKTNNKVRRNEIKVIFTSSKRSFIQ